MYGFIQIYLWIGSMVLQFLTLSLYEISTGTFLIFPLMCVNACFLVCIGVLFFVEKENSDEHAYTVV
jgi:hypothetical protein